MQIPQITYLPRSNIGSHSPCLTIGGEVIHEIEDLRTFYEEVGYNDCLAKLGILPDEFIWDTYVKRNRSHGNNCYQLNIIEYLLKHSAKFTKKYGDQCGSWIAVHAEARASCSNKLCLGQKQLPQCEKVFNSTQNSQAGCTLSC